MFDLKCRHKKIATVTFPKKTVRYECRNFTNHSFLLNMIDRSYLVNEPPSKCSIFNVVFSRSSK